MISLITGASSGIGFELASLMVKDGHTVIAVARDKKRLNESVHLLETRAAAGAKVHTVAVDLSDQEGPSYVYKEVQKLGLKVDCLVNNAGFGATGAFAEVSLDTHMQLLRTNIVALTQLTHFFLPDMIAGSSGRILNVASTAAFRPGPYMATYYASKAYVLSFSEGIREELRGTGVTVTTLCPGPTNSNFAKRAHAEHLVLFDKARVMEAGAVAKRAYKALLAGEGVVVVGTANRLLSSISRFVPTSLSTRILRHMQNREE